MSQSKKRLLLVTSEKVGETGKISFQYLFDFPKKEGVDLYDTYPDYCDGPFGYVRQAPENKDIFLLNVFEGGKGFMFGGPISANDPERNKKIINESFPEVFSMLCSSEVAAAIKPLLEEFVEITVAHSEKALMTS